MVIHYLKKLRKRTKVPNMKMYCWWRIRNIFLNLMLWKI